ncbi:MAG TPA: hypothetical protein PLX68_07170 [Dermatophilaceae bacterium]|nr:hypothetical protein [Dermatophilaceae bacterium]
MADPTSFRPSRTRLRWLRATGLVVVLGALVLPSSWAAEALGLRHSVVEYQRFQDWSTPISEVMVNAGDTWIEVVRSEGVSGKGVVWLERSCVLPSPSPPWWEVSAGGLEVFADPVLGWEQLVRRCETWVHVFVDQGVRVRVWDQTRSTISELDPGVAHWEIGAGGRVSTTPR